MKIAWRKILSNWKENLRASRCSSIPKDEFPSLLKKLLAELSDKSSDNLKAGFRKTGIFPLNRDEPMNRLPNRLVNREPAIQETVADVFLEHLNETRATVTKTTERKKRKLLNVPAGKSIGPSDMKATTTSVESNEDQQQPMNMDNSHQSEFKKLRTKRKFTEFDNDSNSSTFSLRDSSDSELDLADALSDISTVSDANLTEKEMQIETENEMQIETEEEMQIETDKEMHIDTDKHMLTDTEKEMQMETEKMANMFVEDFILVEFTSNLGKKKTHKYYICRITERLETDHMPQFYCKFLRVVQPKGNIFHYPEVDDLCIIDYSQVKAIVKLEKEFRGKYYFADLPNYDIS